ncbi:cyclic pyranopterin monophosphate synthase MoaC [Chloroflexota bacterium]
MNRLTHVSSSGEAEMVDVGQKGDTEREAVAKGKVIMKRTTLEQIKTVGLQKGDVIAVARVAGIMAAKRTPYLIPLCHLIMISDIRIEFDLSGDDYIEIIAKVKGIGKTGVEMEALVSATVAALTTKAKLSRKVPGSMGRRQFLTVRIEGGGRGGTYRRK